METCRFQIFSTTNPHPPPLPISSSSSSHLIWQKWSFWLVYSCAPRFALGLSRHFSHEAHVVSYVETFHVVQIIFYAHSCAITLRSYLLRSLSISGTRRSPLQQPPPGTMEYTVRKNFPLFFLPFESCRIFLYLHMELFPAPLSVSSLLLLFQAPMFKLFKLIPLPPSLLVTHFHHPMEITQ